MEFSRNSRKKKVIFLEEVIEVTGPCATHAHKEYMNCMNKTQCSKNNPLLDALMDICDKDIMQEDVYEENEEDMCEHEQECDEEKQECYKKQECNEKQECNKKQEYNEKQECNEIQECNEKQECNKEKQESDNERQKCSEEKQERDKETQENDKEKQNIQCCKPTSDDWEQTVKITFSVPEELGMASNFFTFEMWVDMFLAELHDQENIFRRQVEATEERANLIMKNNSRIENLNHFVNQVREVDKKLEIDMVLLNSYLCELEGVVHSVEVLEPPLSYHNLNRINLYNLFLMVYCNIKDIETQLEEVKNYFTELQFATSSSPCVMIQKIAMINENTIRKLMFDISNLESTAAFVDNQMGYLENSINISSQC